MIAPLAGAIGTFFSIEEALCIDPHSETDCSGLVRSIESSAASTSASLSTTSTEARGFTMTLSSEISEIRVRIGSTAITSN